MQPAAAAQFEDELRYPGTCRARPVAAGMPAAIRRAGRARACSIHRPHPRDAIRQDVAAAVGDFILKRRDQIYAYVLAVTVDDAAQGVTRIVPRRRSLGQHAPPNLSAAAVGTRRSPAYAHVPVLTEADGGKLAKVAPQRALWPRILRCRSCCRSFRCWGWRRPTRLPAATIPEAWSWAIAQWSANQVPRRLELRVSG